MRYWGFQSRLRCHCLFRGSFNIRPKLTFIIMTQTNFNQTNLVLNSHFIVSPSSQPGRSEPNILISKLRFIEWLMDSGFCEQVSQSYLVSVPSNWTTEDLLGSIRFHLHCRKTGIWVCASAINWGREYTTVTCEGFGLRSQTHSQLEQLGELWLLPCPASHCRSS